MKTKTVLPSPLHTPVSTPHLSKICCWRVSCSKVSLIAVLSIPPTFNNAAFQSLSLDTMCFAKLSLVWARPLFLFFLFSKQFLRILRHAALWSCATLANWLIKLRKRSFVLPSLCNISALKWSMVVSQWTTRLRCLKDSTLLILLWEHLDVSLRSQKLDTFPCKTWRLSCSMNVISFSTKSVSQSCF